MSHTPGPLETLLEQLVELKMVLKPELDDIEAMRELIKPQLEEINSLEAHIKKQALDEGIGAEIDGAKVTIRAGYTRTSWDSKALVGYAVVHPEINELRKQSEVKPSAIIKIN